MKAIFFVWIFIIVLAITVSLVVACGDDDDDDDDGNAGGNDDDDSGNDVDVKDGTTDSDGLVAFYDKDTGEEVLVKVENSFSEPLPGINVRFFDGSTFELFFLEDPSASYEPNIEVYPHNSFHTITMLSPNEGEHVVVLTENDPLYEPVGNASDYITSNENTIFIGCYTKEEYEKKVEIKTGIFSFLYGPGMKAIFEGVDKYEDFLDPTGESPDCVEEWAYVSPDSFITTTLYNVFESDCCLEDQDDDDDVDDDDDSSGEVWTDSTSGLMWQNGDSVGVEKYGESESRYYCENLNWGGYSDWRLPTISELRTLVRGCPAIETGGECGVTDDCNVYSSCWSWGECHQKCPFGQGPNNGCYWPSELKGSCGEDDSYWSSTEAIGGYDEDYIWWMLDYYRPGFGTFWFGCEPGVFPIRCVR